MKRFEHREEKWEFPFVEYSGEPKNEKVPLIVQLHGAGERGSGTEDLEKVDILSTTDYRIAKAIAFAWKKDELIPIGDAEEKGINMPSTPDRDFCLFTANDVNAVINNDNVILSRAPIEIDDELYLSAEDFKKIG